VTSAHRKLALLFSEGHNVDSATGVFLEGKRLHDDEVLRVCRRFYVHQFVDLVGRFEQVGVGILAEFTLEVAPEESRDLRGLLTLHLQTEPVLEALVVDKAHSARAVAGNDAWVI